MNTLARLLTAGAFATLSAPALAMTSSTPMPTMPPAAAAQQATTEGAGNTEFCIAADRCALALPASYLVRYDQRMDEILGR